MAAETTKNRQAFTTNVNTKKPTPTITANDSSGRGFTMAIVALVVVGLGVIAFLATNRESDVPDGEQIGAVDIEGPALIQFPDGASVTNASTDAAVGTTAPTLTGLNFDELEVKIEPDGRNKAVYFLAHWCPNCQDEVPQVQSLIDGGSLPDNVDVYAVTTSVTQSRPNYPPETWLKKEGWTGTILRDDENSRAFNAYGGASFPYVVYLDGDNNVVSRSAGTLEPVLTQTIWEGLAAGSLIEADETEGNVTEVDGGVPEEGDTDTDDGEPEVEE